MLSEDSKKIRFDIIREKGSVIVVFAEDYERSNRGFPLPGSALQFCPVRRGVELKTEDRRCTRVHRLRFFRRLLSSISFRENRGTCPRAEARVLLTGRLFCRYWFCALLPSHSANSGNDHAACQYFIGSQPCKTRRQPVFPHTSLRRKRRQFVS